MRWRSGTSGEGALAQPMMSEHVPRLLTTISVTTPYSPVADTKVILTDVDMLSRHPVRDSFAAGAAADL